METEELSIQQMQEKLTEQGRTIQLLGSRIRLLEEENHTFASQLADCGIKVRESSRTVLELPPPVTEEIDENSASFRFLADPERRLAAELLGGDAVYVLEKSESVVDVGHWLGAGVVWVAATAADLVMFAAGKQPYMEQAAYPMLYRSLYNHVTGELVLAPVEGLRLSKIKLAPRAAYQLLAQIYQKEEMDA